MAQAKYSGKQQDSKQRDIRAFLPPPLDASASGHAASVSADSPRAAGADGGSVERKVGLYH